MATASSVNNTINSHGKTVTFLSSVHRNFFSFQGEGQLEISINDGDVPNAVQVLGGGKCLVTYTPEQPITHEIEVTFNGEQVPGSPFLCRVMDPSNSVPLVPKNFDPDSIVKVELEHLGLISINAPSQFTIRVAGGDDAELAVSVQGML